MRAPPRFRKHRRGYWFCRWAGRDHYLGRDKARARERYLHDQQRGLPAWARWKTARQEQRQQFFRPSSTLTIEDLAEQFLASRLREGGPERARYYRSVLKVFVAIHGPYPASTMRPMWLQAVKDALIDRGRAPKTVNHTVSAVQTLFRFGEDLELIRPVNLRGVRLLPLGEIPDKAMSVTAARTFVLGAPYPLRPWLAICYLCALRPVETVRVVTRQGEWAERGVYRVANKAWQSVRIARHVLFSAEAFRWYRQCEPVWSRSDSFGRACRVACGTGPHRLRHSAASHLLTRRVPRDQVAMILGHYPGRVSLVYMQPQWRTLRRLVSRITLQNAERHDQA